MILSNLNVKKITEHSNTIISLFRFDNNDSDHYISLSDDGQLKEWAFRQYNGSSHEIDQCILIRPSEEILKENKHKIPKISKNDYLKITKCIIFGHFIALGYEDGLILIYSQELQKGMRFQGRFEKEAIEEKAEIADKEHDENEEGEGGESNDNSQARIDLEVSNPNNNNNGSNGVSKANTIEYPSKKYYNAFSLYYILLGHSQKISSFYYIKSKNTLITASDSYIVKIYDMSSGHSLYHFNLDCIVEHIMFIDINKKEELIFLCQEPYKLVIDIQQEPFSFNHYTFKWNNINSVYHCIGEKENNAILLLGKSSNFYYFSSTMEYKQEIREATNDSLEYMMKYEGNYIVFDDKLYMRFMQIALKPGESTIKTLFKIPIGKDSISQGINIGSWGLIACQDGVVYGIDFNKEIQLYYNRSRMVEEDAISLLMNKASDGKKGKKPKKGAKEAIGTTKKSKGDNKSVSKEKLPKIKDKKKKK